MRLLLAGITLLLAGSLPTSGQQPTYRTQSDLVVIHAMVEDGRGHAVEGLRKENFIVYEDNVPQTISHFSASDAPASIGLLIDNSTSMMTKRDRVIASAVAFAQLSNPHDEIFVLAFNEDVTTAWHPSILQESDIDLLRATLLQRIAARGRTAVYDALNQGLDWLRTSRYPRQVLVVVSDGSDNASQATRAATLARVGASNAMIYAVILRDPVDRDGDPEFLRELARETGGKAFAPARVDDIPEALEQIARDIRATYTLGYVSTNEARDGKLRHIRVVAGRDGRPLNVRARSGYLAPRPRESAPGGDDA